MEPPSHCSPSKSANTGNPVLDPIGQGLRATKAGAEMWGPTLEETGRFGDCKALTNLREAPLP